MNLQEKGHALAVNLRECIARPKGVFLFGVTNVTGALAAQLAGHEGVYIGGYAFANSVGYPDLGLVDRGEMLQHMERFGDCELIAVPAMGDADDCYGGALNVERVVRDLLEKTTLAAIHIEDQSSPKRCGHIAGRAVIPVSQAVGKIRLACELRKHIDPARIIVARTDAAGAANGGGIRGAIERACRYIDAGVDVVWCEKKSANSPHIVEFAEGVHRHVPGFPLAINISPSFSDWPECAFGPDDFARLGYKLPFATYPALRAAVDAEWRIAKEYKNNYVEGARALERRTRGGPGESIMKLMHVDRYQALERRYDPEMQTRQEKSEGHGSEK